MAISKIKRELATVKGDNRVSAVKKHVADALISFCKQDAEFAQAIVQNDKTLADCCESIMKGCGSSISDLEVYRKAVQFYFPGADVSMNMTIDLCASVKKPGKTAKVCNAPVPDAALPAPPSTVISLNLDDFLA
jgi:hypothetical protein